ncbi:hypothetical protein TWF173_010260 [Orbilia oligospora]|nr:hypothetical protein TWF173_010260 [Orbilia oligospora]
MKGRKGFAVKGSIALSRSRLHGMKRPEPVDYWPSILNFILSPGRSYIDVSDLFTKNGSDLLSGPFPSYRWEMVWFIEKLYTGNTLIPILGRSVRAKFTSFRSKARAQMFLATVFIV